MNTPTDKSALADEELLQLYRSSGNKQYLGTLLQRYTLMLFGVCMKYMQQEDDAKDAVQQVFTKVIAQIDRHQVTFFKSWLYTVARNHCLMELRKKQVMLPEEYIEAGGQEADGVGELSEAAKRERTLALLEKGLAELAEPQQQCLTLFYLQKKSYKEISVITGFEPMMVKSHIQNGKRNLRNYLTKNLPAV